MDVICSSPEVLCWAFSFSTGCRQWLCGKRYTQLRNMEVSCFGISTMMIEVDIVLQLRTVFNFLELILVRYEPLNIAPRYIYINKINSTNQNKQKERFFILIAKGKKKRFFLSGLDSKSSEAQYNKEPGLDSVPAHIHLSG